MSAEYETEKVADRFAKELAAKFNLTLPDWSFVHEMEAEFSIPVCEFGVPTNDVLVVIVTLEEDEGEVDEGRWGRFLSETYKVAVRTVLGDQKMIDTRIAESDILDTVEGIISDLMDEEA